MSGNFHASETSSWAQAKFHIVQELLGRLHATVAFTQKREAYVSLLEELNEWRQEASHKMKKMFNRSFGATFLTDKGQESAFAYHIHQYADVYTSKPENFLLYPPEAWLHVPFDIKIMPHHVKVCLTLNFQIILDYKIKTVVSVKKPRFSVRCLQINLVDTASENFPFISVVVQSATIVFSNFDLIEKKNGSETQKFHIMLD